MKNLIASITTTFGLFFSMLGQSGEPTCHTHNSGPYCSYTGKVQQIYVNSSNTILLYFDTPMASGAAESVGISGITQQQATIYSANDNSEFARMFYSTALAAQASGRNVSIQMRGNKGGYLKFDRIWLSSE